jgi:hypothetical protein
MTTINPSIGHAVWTQGGVGTSPGYDCVDARRCWTPPERGEGVASYNSFRVSQRAAGSNMSVDISMDEKAYIRGDAIAHQEIYDVAVHPSTINEPVSTAHGTLPRVDQVVLQVLDHAHDGSGSSLAQTTVLAGTPTSGATLDNRSGVAALPGSTLLLADVLVAAADTSISDSEIRDRRPFIAGVPTPLTKVDMVALESPAALLQADVGNDVTHSLHDLRQSAVLVWVPRRIVGATRMRWKYVQGSTALTGNYAFAIFDSAGTKIIDTGSVAFTGASASLQPRSEVIAATTFEVGWHYLFFGVDTAALGNIGVTGYTVGAGTAGFMGYPNVALFSTTGGVTVPANLLAFTDAGPSSASVTGGPKVPQVSLSVG